MFNWFFSRWHWNVQRWIDRFDFFPLHQLSDCFQCFFFGVYVHGTNHKVFELTRLRLSGFILHTHTQHTKRKKEKRKNLVTIIVCDSNTGPVTFQPPENRSMAWARAHASIYSVFFFRSLLVMLNKKKHCFKWERRNNNQNPKKYRIITPSIAHTGMKCENGKKNSAWFRGKNPVRWVICYCYNFNVSYRMMVLLGFCTFFGVFFLLRHHRRDTFSVCRACTCDRKSYNLHRAVWSAVGWLVFFSYAHKMVMS